MIAEKTRFPLIPIEPSDVGGGRVCGNHSDAKEHDRERSHETHR